MPDAKLGIHDVYAVMTQTYAYRYPSYHDAVIDGVLESGPCEWMQIQRQSVMVHPKVGTTRTLVCQLLNDGVTFLESETLFYTDSMNTMLEAYRICTAYNEGILLPEDFSRTIWWHADDRKYLINNMGDTLDVWKWENDVTSPQQYFAVNAVTEEGVLVHGRVGVDSYNGRFKPYAKPWPAIKNWFEYHNKEV